MDEKNQLFFAFMDAHPHPILLIEQNQLFFFSESVDEKSAFF
jgi:hypothetical protein